MIKYLSPILLFVGALTLGASVFIGYFVVPYKIWENIMEQSKIVQGNTRFNNWERVPIPLFQRIYFFNVTNPDDVILGGKPILQEIGPYVYQQKRQKFDIVFNEDNDTIFYNERTDIFFRADLSNGTESDAITFINLPFVSVAKKIMQLDSITRYVITETLTKYPNERLYSRTTIGELMFGGRYVHFIEDLAEMNGEEILPNNTFGLYYGKNGSDQGRFEIFSGVKHPNRFGNVISWNGKTSLDWYEDDYCNRINGSDGGVFQPYSTKEQIFYMFIPGLCKSFRFEFDEDGIDVKGIPVNKFSISPRFFEIAKTNPDNACYCAEADEDIEKCPESGVFPLEKCGKGAMVLSQPHFYQGSDLYLNQSIGLRPDKERHEMALYIESYTSVTAKVNMRFQMNVDLRPNKFIRSLKKVPKMVHPLFWIDQAVEMPEESAAIIRDKLYGTINIANLLTHIGIVLGIVFIILSLLTFFLYTSRHPDGDEGKIECVSYHPQGTLPKEKSGSGAGTNGKIPNGYANIAKSNNISHRRYENYLEMDGDVGVPFLKQNGQALSLYPSVTSTSATDSGQAELIVTFCTDNDDDDDSYATTLTTDSNSKEGSHFPSSNYSQNSTTVQDESDSAHEPDSRLSPFPVVTHNSSSLSISNENSVNNTRRDLVEATSSYENL